MAMRPLDNPAALPRKVQLVAIDRAGRKTHHWPDKTDKHTYGHRANLRPPVARVNYRSQPTTCISVRVWPTACASCGMPTSPRS